ncbi:hypothetical protein QEH59_18205 [Coraliomargarita sp. SDUM461004]|uniref:DUF4760 domain-containing protein n=1 Tax=Thalassobacterium sedimentorum TaxID=3041258 RepID=A0ABU1ANW3_9BACT|nr:hypothetical protein [Coraliomargarita sp. SDUM461004]MDQ8196369.1 hypothetical protein [Coraliomargarita sp. SDUM461004]
MIDPETSLLTTLTPAIFALIGVLIGSGLHFLGLVFDRKWKREQKLAERFEELTDLVSETLIWSQSVGNAKNLKELSSRTTSKEARRMVSLCMIYFRELEKPAKDYANCLISYFDILARSFDPAIPHTVGAQAVKHNEKAYMECADEIMNLRNDLEDLIKKHSKKYAKV